MIASTIGQVSQIKNLHTEQSLQTNVCDLCKSRPADGLLARICAVCTRKLQYQNLPESEKEKYILSVVPERYIGAEISHLPTPIQDIFSNDIANGVFLWGTTGSGKTYSLAALAKKYLTDGYTVKRVHYEMLCLRLRDTFNKNSNTTEFRVIEPLLNCDKLFIEDVGVSRQIGNQETDFSIRTFTLILDMRLEKLKPTFITSNKSLENIEQSFDERVSDRLRLFHIFAMKSKSKRIEAKK